MGKVDMSGDAWFRNPKWNILPLLHTYHHLMVLQTQMFDALAITYKDNWHNEKDAYFANYVQVKKIISVVFCRESLA